MYGLDRTGKRVQNESTHQLPKTDVRYWRDKLTQRINDEWHARIRFGGVQNWWPLKTTNHARAALKASDIWLSLQTHGFPTTEAKFKPWTIAPAPTPAQSVTVGDFVKAVTAVAIVRPTTLTAYTCKLRFLVSQVAKIKGARSRHDYVHGGAAG
jgi:hypothetical protein